MVDGDVCVSVMTLNLCQQQWPHICVNSNGLSEEVLIMAYWHIVHIDTQLAREAIRPRSLLEGPLVYGGGALGMGTINEGASQGNINRFW
jgi:hypothetical protein